MRFLLMALGASAVAVGISYGTVVRFAGHAVPPREAGNILSATFADALGGSSERNGGKLFMEISRVRPPAESAEAGAPLPSPQKDAPREAARHNVVIPPPAPTVLVSTTRVEDFVISAPPVAPTSAPPAAAPIAAPASSPAMEVCDFSERKHPTHLVLLNEIAWMGLPLRGGEDGAGGAQAEWIELKNNSGRDIDLADWRITNRAGKFKIDFDSGDEIRENTYFLLERGDDETVPDVPADRTYSGALSNGGDWLRLFDARCALVDEVDASHGWPAGDNAAKKTMERSAVDLSWNTSGNVGGTPGAFNSSMYARNSPPLHTAPPAPLALPAQAPSPASSSLDASLSAAATEKININTAGASELEGITGVGTAIAQKIIDYRTQNGPFSAIEDIIKVSGIGDVTFEKMKDEITVGEVASSSPPSAPPEATVPAKININTAGLAELDNITGVGPAIAQRIIDYRTANGPFAKIEDIKNVKGIGGATFEKMKDEITI